MNPGNGQLQSKQKMARYVINFNIGLNALAFLVLGAINLVVGGFLAGYGAYVTLLPYLLLPLILAADVYVLYRLSRPFIRPGLWTYFAITRSVAMLAVIYNYYRFVTVDSITDGGTGVRTFFTLGIILLLGLLGVGIYQEIKGKWQLLLLMIATIAALSATFFLANSIKKSQQANPGTGPAGIRHDERIARDFQFISQDVRSSANTNNPFPARIQEL